MIITTAPEDRSATIPDLLASVDTPIFFPAKNGFVPAADVPAATDTFPSGRNAGADVEYKLPFDIPSVNPKVFPVPQTGIVKPKAVFPFGILNEPFLSVFYDVFYIARRRFVGRIIQVSAGVPKHRHAGRC